LPLDRSQEADTRGPTISGAACCGFEQEICEFVKTRALGESIAESNPQFKSEGGGHFLATGIVTRGLAAATGGDGDLGDLIVTPYRKGRGPTDNKPI